MTIDEHLNVLMSKLPFTNNSTDHRIRGELKTALLEVARDQRHACGRAIEGVEVGCETEREFRRVVYRAAMNATLEAK